MSVKETPKNTQMDKKDSDFIAFWKPDKGYPYRWLGQWFPSIFVLNNTIVNNFPTDIKGLRLFKERYDVVELLMQQNIFNTPEKFMMMGKASLFKDLELFAKLGSINSPKDHKYLGRYVKNFNDNVWNTYCQDIVKIGNYLKFSQSDVLRELLKSTGSAILVEGSPFDKIWGVGLRFDDPNIKRIDKWKGKNYLGVCLMFVRNII